MTASAQIGNPQSAIGNVNRPADLEALRPAPHALIPPHTEKEADAWLDRLMSATAAEQGLMVDALLARKKLLAAAAADPLWHGIEPDIWKEPDAALAVESTEAEASFGVNRSTKSWRAAKRLCEAALTYPDGFHCAVSETDQTSINIQQPLLWQFLQPHIGHLNWKEKYARTQKVKYTAAGGFTEGLVILPNRTRIIIDTYKGDPGKWEGIEWGARVERMLKRRDGSPILNIGWWADESLTIKWLEMLMRRSRFRQAKGIWAYTPQNGITPCIKEVLQQLRVFASRPAELLPNAHVAGCPRGHMPTLGETVYHRSRVSVCWFHIDNNPLGGYRAIVRKNLEHATTEMIERFGYGYARDTIGRAFGNFGPWNIVRPEELPERGTNYMICDPADVRPFFCIWVRVVTGLGGRPVYYVYRDWPDKLRYGEWAVPTERKTSKDNTKGWDGDPGPAQSNPNLGVNGYKALWRELESVRALAKGTQGTDPATPERFAAARAMEGTERDPYRKRLQMKLAAGETGREEIFERYIDARAGPREHLAEQGNTSMIEEFELGEECSSLTDSFQQDDAQIDGAKLEPIYFELAWGGRIDLNLIKSLLEYRRDGEGRMAQAPRLFVCNECEQVIWALYNYTGQSGETGASKDIIDVLRYAAGADLVEMTDEMYVIKRAHEWRGSEDDE